MSDHKGEEAVWIMQYYYNAKKDLKNKTAFPKTKIDQRKIVFRCRYLRSIDENEALKKVTAMTLAVERIVEEFNADVVFGMVMDSYLLDIFDLVMRSKDSQYLGFLNNMINGYSRLTSRGELICLSRPSKENIDKALNELCDKNYVPNMQNDFMWKTTILSMFFTKFLKEKIKILYYAIKKVIDRDPDNFYFNTVASTSCMSCRNLNQLFYRKYQNNDWLIRIKKAKEEGKKIVYMPLQFYPECSIDYWGTSEELSNFYEVVKKIISNKYEKVLIVAKEHPSATGLRKISFYKQFSENSEVILAPFDVPSNLVIEHAEVILTWTGSVGVEAIMRDKCLVTFGDAYYDYGYGIKKLENYMELSRLDSVLEKVAENGVKPEKEKIVEYMLTGLIEGYIFPLDYATKKNPVNNEKMELLARGINDYVITLSKVGSYGVREGSL
ncbi:MAG: hypothetical protein K6L75_02075 [Cellvibrionaceae bacterium]